MQKILVIGSMNMDMTVRVKDLPKPGETILSLGLTYDLGGKGANQACAAGRLGGNVRMLGCVGNDDFGKQQLQALLAAGIDVSGIREAEGIPTGTAVICVSEKGNNCIVVESGANLACDEEYLLKQEATIRESDIVLAQMEIPEEALYRAIRIAADAHRTVILNPAPAPESIPEEIYKRIDYLTPNETELMRLAGLGEDSLNGEGYKEALETGARKLLEKRVKAIIVTLGENGCALFRGEEVFYYPGRKVDAVDTTAAGDCFNGAFAVALAEGMDETEAIEFAVNASAISVTRKGAQKSLPLREEVLKMIQGV